ncbi:MAG TPA: hypothetical protein VNW99_08150 [Cytophagaceae bacterium]|jgi:hypothetical protein|nr:hypothetical protein [Cytophagaceae bacterium]
MKRNQVCILLLCFLSLEMQSCTSKKEEVLNPCDTSKVSYAKNIVPIVSQNCYKCHDSGNARLFGGGHYLDSYDSLKAHIKCGLIDAIEHNAGVIPMPEGAPKLPDCDIAKIKAWVNQGALNN